MSNVCILDKLDSLDHIALVFTTIYSFIQYNNIQSTQRVCNNMKIFNVYCMYIRQIRQLRQSCTRLFMIMQEEYTIVYTTQ